MSLLKEYAETLARHGGPADVRARVRMMREYLTRKPEADWDEEDRARASWLVDVECLLSLIGSLRVSGYAIKAMTPRGVDKVWVMDPVPIELKKRLSEAGAAVDPEIG